MSQANDPDLGTVFYNHCGDDEPTVGVFTSSGPNANDASHAICGLGWDWEGGGERSASGLPQGVVVGTTDRKALVLNDNDFLRILVPGDLREYAFELAQAGIRDASPYSQLSFNDCTGGLRSGVPWPQSWSHYLMAVITVKGPGARKCVAPEAPDDEESFLPSFEVDGKFGGYLEAFAADEYVLICEDSLVRALEGILMQRGATQCNLEELRARGSALLEL